MGLFSFFLKNLLSLPCVTARVREERRQLVVTEAEEETDLSGDLPRRVLGKISFL